MYVCAYANSTLPLLLQLYKLFQKSVLAMLNERLRDSVWHWATKLTKAVASSSLVASTFLVDKVWHMVKVWMYLFTSWLTEQIKNISRLHFQILIPYESIYLAGLAVVALLVFVWNTSMKDLAKLAEVQKLFTLILRAKRLYVTSITSESPKQWHFCHRQGFP